MEVGIRPEILEFAEHMEAVMRKHDNIKGDSWRNVEVEYLIKKLNEEHAEFTLYCKKEELIDIANICMMIWQRRRTTEKELSK